MLSAVAWATAPPPAHHVARGALPRLPPPAAAVGKGKAAPGPRRKRGRRPGSPGLTMSAGSAVPPASASPMPRGSTQAPLHGRSPLPTVGTAQAPPQPPSPHCRAAAATL